MAQLAKTLLSTRLVRRAGDGLLRVLPRLAATARFFVNASRVHKKALMYICLCIFTSAAWSAPVTPPGTLISNTATANFSIGVTPATSNSNTAQVTTATCIAVGVKVELLQYNPAGAAVQVEPGWYSTDGTTASVNALTNPIMIGGASTNLPASVNLSPVGSAGYARNETIIVRVISYDANINSAAQDFVWVTLTTSGGDSELVRLTETGISTGEFVAAVPAATGAPVVHDGTLSFPANAHNQTITATYNDSNCSPATVANTSGLVDPYGIVFDSATGVAVDGAQVTLIDTSTGLPANVLCDDGVTPLVTDPVTHSITSGSPTNCDPGISGNGYFRFPQVSAGQNYRLVVVPPLGNVFPSAVAPAGLPASIGSPGSPPVILGTPGAGGSYGDPFFVAGSALKVDIPVDSGGKTLTILKTSDMTTAGIGDFVPYTLTITNNTAMPFAGAQIADYLPPGFRYQKGSARQNGVAIPDPVISADASTMTFNLSLAASATATVRYVVEVTPAAHTGAADNTAAATGGLTSNTAHASVIVTQDLYSDKAFLVGRVIDGSCDDKVENDAKGLANVRILLEDGTYILTDQEGRWHIDNLRPGTHVVQLDLDSLPDDYEVVACENNDRFAGRTYSQFVNLQGGTLWRADFYVHKKAPGSALIKQTLSAQAADDSTIVSLDLDSSADVTGYSATVMLPESAKYVSGSATLNGKPVADPDRVENALIFRSQAHTAHWQDHYSFMVKDVAVDASIKSMVRVTPPGRAAQSLPVAQITLVNHGPASAETSGQVVAQAADIRPAKVADEDSTQLVEKLPYDAAWLASAKPGDEWLHPRENFHPNIPAIKAAVKHAPGQTVKLRLNGEDVKPLYFDGTKTNAEKTVALSTWNGIHILDGDNRLELIISDADGKVVSDSVRIIHLSAMPDHVEFVPQQSRLIADGKTRPIIAVRMLDKDGAPARRGITGEFTLNDPYRSHDRREGMDREPLAGRIGGKAHFVVKSDGLAMIELEPTTQTGEAILGFQFDNNTPAQEVRAWLEPGQRDWVLVGFGQGTLGQKTLSGNMQALQDAGADQQLFDQNGLAFYAKGSIRGDYLLTLAYDTTKQTGSSQFKQAVDPTQYYTLYADATQANFDAASSSRLYVKLERKQFYAMFGDYDTGLTVTELSRYSRSLTGVKSEYKGDKAGYNAFASATTQSYIKDEIPGNGTSGVYKLSRNNLMINSDKVRIETRDRFQSQNIVSTQYLTRYLDYDIDYNNGTLTFREPVASRDGSFNPTYIVAEYESTDSTDQRTTLGGRGSFKPADGVELGATLVHDGTVGASGNLQGVDASIQLDAKTKIRAEAAMTTGNNTGVSSSGNAWLGEVTHHEELWDATAYVRQESDGFGIGQQAASEIGTRKMGLDARYKLTDTTLLLGQTYQQESMSSGTQNNLLEGRVENRISEALSAYYGARTSHDQNTTGNGQSNQLLGGTAYSMLDRKMTLHADAEVSPGTAGSSTMPNRLILGADYRVSEQSKVFAEQEFARGEQISANTTRVGIRTQPWTGGEMSASVGDDINNDAERLYANLGMVQRWQITEHWQTNFSIDRTQTLKNTAVPLNNDTPLPSGSGGLAQLPSPSADYIATAVGAAYHDTLWSCDGRIEIRNSTLDQQRNLQLGVQRNLDQGRSVAAGYSIREVFGSASNSRNNDLRASYAYRPNDSQWILFDRADYIIQSSQTTASSLDGSKLVNNLNTNYMPNRRTQIALQYGSKYVLETIDGTDYKGYTDLIGTEVRHDITPRWDIGVFGSVMRSVNAGVRSYGLGGSVGYKVVDNMWLSAGYNVRGMDDRDFSNASYRAKGAYITLRMKVDQDTFGLNKGRETTRPLTSE